jgi:hypothetical protein
VNASELVKLFFKGLKAEAYTKVLTKSKDLISGLRSTNFLLHFLRVITRDVGLIRHAMDMFEFLLVSQLLAPNRRVQLELSFSKANLVGVQDSGRIYVSAAQFGCWRRLIRVE